jgi:protein TonB
MNIAAADARRWGVSFVSVLLAHGLIVLVAACWLAPAMIPSSPTQVMLVELAPPATPPLPPSEQPVGPQQVKTEAAKPRPKLKIDPVKTPPLPNPAVVLPVELPQPPRPDTAEVEVQDTTAPASPPLPPAPQLSSGQQTWQVAVLAALDKAKRYPSNAQSAHQQGVPYVRFTMDRQGNVLSSALERSSGFRSLDDAAMALPKRAAPLPKPPASVLGEAIELVVPVEFFMRGQ